VRLLVVPLFGPRIERIAEMHKWGDLTREAWLTEREHLKAELATCEWQRARLRCWCGRRASIKKDLLAAWEAANPEQRNALACLDFESIKIEDDRVLAVVPQPDFAPSMVDRSRRDGGGNVDTPASSGCLP
jgi:hypothetical protein